MTVRHFLSALLFYFVFACGIVGLTQVADASAATVYVNSSTGNDSTGSGTSESPYASFHKGYTMALAGDTLNLTGTLTWTDAGETGDASGSGYTLGKNLTIQGQSAASTIIQAASTVNTADRSVFTVSSGVTVTLNNVTVRYGVTTVSTTGGGVTVRGTLTVNSSIFTNNKYTTATTNYYGGGAIMVDQNATLTVNTSTFSNNVFDGMYYGSGAIYSSQSTTITINGSTFTGNSATSTNPTTFAYSYAEPSGALGVFRFTTTKVTNCTFTGNTTNAYGGAIQVYYPNSFHLTNNTIVGNTASAGAGGVLFESVTDGYNLFVKNTIMANNIGNGSANDFYVVSGSAGRITDNGYNIVELSTNKTWSATGDITGDQGSLNISGALADNAASNGVQTLALESGSVAINAGNSSANGVVSVPTTDQRGVARSGTTDVGAYEFSDATPPTITSVSSDKSNGTYGAGTIVDIDITFSEAVTSTGSVTVTLETGTVDQTCTFTVSSSSTGTCNYTVQAGDASADLNVNSISGTIADSASNAMSNFVPTTNLSSNKALVIDTTAPTITSVSSDKVDGAYAVGEVIDIDVTFSEAVTSTGLVTVTLETGTVDRTCTFSVSNSTTGTCDYIVQSGDASADLTVSSISGTIADAGANALTNFVPATNLADSKSLVIETTAPVVSVLSPFDDATSVSLTANLVITFSEVVDVMTGNILVKKSADDSILETIDVTGVSVTGTGTTTITIDPTVTFEEGTQYYVQIDSTAFDDTIGNSYAGISDETSWSFTALTSSVNTGGGGGGGGGMFVSGPSNANGAGQGSSNSVGSSLSFEDTSGHWAESYSETLKGKCSVTGYQDGEGELLGLFGPDQYITRAELIKIVVGCEANTSLEAEDLDFEDYDLDAWYAPYISYAYEAGWIEGYADGSLRPEHYVTREEAVKIIMLSQFSEEEIQMGTLDFVDVSPGEWFTSFVSFGARKGFFEGYLDADGNRMGVFGVNNYLTRGEAAKIVVNVLGL
jgi:hypothetical protein